MAPTTDIKAGQVTLNQQEPWPGLRTFSENNADFFFGRDEEIDAIYRMIKQETLTILFGKSGLGKSSILQAGVSPKLRADTFIPIYIRLNHHEETLPLEDQVEVFIEDIIAENNIDAPAPIREETLWEYFHKKSSDWWDQDNHLLKPVLIFDQFEEILTAGHENAARASRCISFLTELEDLIENRPPKNLLKRFKEEKGLAKKYDLKRVDYRVLLSLREDYLADFESLRERMRPIMLNRYRLLPMNSSQAISVILKPGGDLVDESVAEKIIDFVSSAKDLSGMSSIGSYTDKNQVEPALLSVILRELNNHRIQTGENKISSNLVAGKHPEEILDKFYEDGLKGMKPDVRQFIEQQLLTASGARNRVAEEDAVSRFGLSIEDISTLIDRRIIQRDKISHMTWLELSHDTLTPVVKHSAEIYRIKQRRWQIAMRFSTALFAIAIISIATYFNQAREQELQTAEAAKLALDISADLVSSKNIPMSNVQDILDRLDNRFNTLRKLATDSDLIKVHHALFKAKSAKIQLEQGYYGRMSQSALLADDLLFNKQYPLGIDGASLIEKADIKLTVAEALFYSGNFFEAHKQLDLANQFISHAQGDKNVESNLVLLDLRSNRIRIQIWKNENQIFKAVTLFNLILKKYRKLVTQYTDKKNVIDNNYVQRLYEEIFRLYASSLKLISVYQSLNAEEIYTMIKEDMKQSEKFLKDNNTEYWQYVQALSFQFKAKMHQDRNEISDARNSHDISINYLANLIKKDSEHLFYRYSLGSALIQRAEFSITRDRSQAKIDIKTARSLAVTLKRDSDHSYLSCQLSLSHDHLLNRYTLLDKKTGKSEKKQSFTQIIKRINHCRNELNYQNMFNNYELLTYYYQIKFLNRDSKNITSRQEIMKLRNLAFSLLDKQEENGAGNIYLSSQRYYIHSVILTSQLAQFLDDDIVAVGLLDTIKQLNLLLKINSEAAEQYSADKLLFMRKYAKHLLKKNQYQDAMNVYQKQIAFGIKQAKLYPYNTEIIENTILGATYFIKSSDKHSNWISAIETFELLIQLYSHQNKLEEKDFLIAVWYIDESHKQLKTLNEHYKESLVNENKTNIISEEQNLLQIRMKKLLALFSNASKELKKENDNKPKKILSAIKEETFDPKILKIKYLKKVGKNQYFTNKPLGWTTSPFYTAPWSYTITGIELEPYSKLAKKEQQIKRVRVTALPFYEKGRLLTIEFFDNNHQYRTKYYLESEPGGKLYHLNGASAPIHAANKKFPLHFKNPADVAAYVRFFTTFLQTEDGSYLPVESIAEIPWSNNVPQEEKQKVANLLRPLIVWKDDKKTDVWYATATVNYSNVLFHAKYKIHNKGMIEMLNDIPVAVNLLVNSFKMTGNSGRSNNFIERLSLDIIQNVNVSDIKDEFYYLKSVLRDTTHLSPTHRESLMHEALSIIEVMIENNTDSIDKLHRTIIALQKLLNSKLLESIKIKTSLKNIHSTLAKKQMDKVRSLENDNSIKEKRLLSEYTRLAFFQLFSEDFQESLNAAKKAIKIDNDRLAAHTNYAHALLLLDRTDEALAIYQKYKGQPLNGKTWNEIILEDFEQLESAGITHASIKKIKTELSKNTSH